MASHSDELGAREATMSFLQATFQDGVFAIGGDAWSDAFANLHHFAMSAKPSPKSRVVDGNHLDFTSPSFWHLCCYVLYHWTLTRSTNEHYAEYFGSRLYRGQAQNWPMLPSRWRLSDKQRGVRYETWLSSFFRKEEKLEEGLEFYLKPEQFHIAASDVTPSFLPAGIRAGRLFCASARLKQWAA